MKKIVYALYRTDMWNSRFNRDLLVVAGSIRRCCKIAKDDGATKEQIEELREHRQSQCSGEDYEYCIDSYTLNESLIG